MQEGKPREEEGMVAISKSMWNLVDDCRSVSNCKFHLKMTYFLGAKRVHKITTGKSYDELLQHDNKMRIWARSENSEVENL